MARAGMLGQVQPSMESRERRARLRIVKLVHTAAWAFFAGCILAIPVLAWRRTFGPAAVLILIVLAECVTVIASGWRCPLTPIAARYTDDRRDNFDIYLPLWLARHNKTLFGGLYLAGSLYTLHRWWTG